MKSVLVICYTFPPSPGVGGRRWAKFSKCLALKNYKVYVVSNYNRSNKISEWISDAETKGINNYPQNVFYPRSYSSQPKTLFDKLKYRFWLMFFKVFSKGALYDRSFFWKKTVHNQVRKIIVENSIKNVIVSGPPFRLMYFTALLKKDLPSLNFILDFRDPWTDNSSFMGFNSLSETRVDFERMMEKVAIEEANYVVSANDYLTEIFKKKYPLFPKKFLTIINGYDTDEIKSNIFKKSETGVINFTLAGTLYPDLEYIFIPLLNYLKTLQTEKPAVFNKIVLNFYGDIDTKLLKTIKVYGLKIVHLHGFQKLPFVKQKLQEADFCMMFSAPNHASNFNTKFYEYLAIKKPIVHFSNNGEISDFLTVNKLGFAIRPESLKEDMDHLLMDFENKTFNYNMNFDSKQYSIESLTLGFEKLLI